MGGTIYELSIKNTRNSIALQHIKLECDLCNKLSLDRIVRCVDKNTLLSSLTESSYN